MSCLHQGQEGGTKGGNPGQRWALVLGALNAKNKKEAPSLKPVPEAPALDTKKETMMTCAPPPMSEWDPGR